MTARSLGHLGYADASRHKFRLIVGGNDLILTGDGAIRVTGTFRAKVNSPLEYKVIDRVSDKAIQTGSFVLR